MPTRLNYYLSLLAGLILCSPVFAELPRTESFALLSRSGTYHMEVPLDKQQRYWLQEKRELRVGISNPDYPPFDMTVSGQDYEGFTADYVGILATALNVSIKVQRFPTRDAAIKALEVGSIDLLGTSNGFEAAHPNLLLSTPYAIDKLFEHQPVLGSNDKGRFALYWSQPTPGKLTSMAAAVPNSLLAAL